MARKVNVQYLDGRTKLDKPVMEAGEKLAEWLVPHEVVSGEALVEVAAVELAAQGPTRIFLLTAETPGLKLSSIPVVLLVDPDGSSYFHLPTRLEQAGTTNSNAATVAGAR
jgi:hypothetical protein